MEQIFKYYPVLFTVKHRTCNSDLLKTCFLVLIQFRTLYYTMVIPIAVATPLNKPALFTILAGDPLVEISTIVLFLFPYCTIRETSSLTVVASPSALVTVATCTIPSLKITPVHQWLFHTEVPHLVIGDSPAPVWIKGHQVPKCYIVFIYIIPNK